MKLENLSNQIKNLDEKQKNAILSIIDLKIESEMDKFLNKIDALETKVDTKMNSMETKVDAKMSSIESSIKVLMFLIGALGLLITVMKFLK